MSQRSAAQHWHIDTPFCTICKSHVTWNFAVPVPHTEEIRRCILLFLCTLAIVTHHHACMYVCTITQVNLYKGMPLYTCAHHIAVSSTCVPHCHTCIVTTDSKGEGGVFCLFLPLSSSLFQALPYHSRARIANSNLQSCNFIMACVPPNWDGHSHPYQRSWAGMTCRFNPYLVLFRRRSKVVIKGYNLILVQFSLHKPLSRSSPIMPDRSWIFCLFDPPSIPFSPVYEPQALKFHTLSQSVCSHHLTVCFVTHFLSRSTQRLMGRVTNPEAVRQM